MKIFKLYANLQSVSNVAAVLKKDGIVNQATQKPYTATEITTFIKKNSIEDNDIEQFVKYIQSKNIKAVKRHM